MRTLGTRTYTRRIVSNGLSMPSCARSTSTRGSPLPGAEDASRLDTGARNNAATPQEVATMQYKLDTGNDGYDEILDGTREECEVDVLHHHDLDELPEHWTLTLIDWE